MSDELTEKLRLAYAIAKESNEKLLDIYFKAEQKAGLYFAIFSLFTVSQGLFFKAFLESDPKLNFLDCVYIGGSLFSLFFAVLIPLAIFRSVKQFQIADLKINQEYLKKFCLPESKFSLNDNLAYLTLTLASLTTKNLNYIQYKQISLSKIPRLLFYYCCSYFFNVSLYAAISLIR